ncbi:MAG: hypothetical protein EAZ99_16165 [Alphaproteobacteria bacterium]|nr:hypothetical protein [Alphaproteobacteria bacterium]TAD87763.1 MAG: hypothetical protein EAZ99_16165 [Alphaproteobacteria bacterium]
MTSITIVPVVSAAQQQQWLRLPWVVMGGDPVFVPPLLALEKRRISSRHSKFFEFGEVALFLALRDGHPVGRISAQVNHRANQHHGQRAVHFGFFECVEDPEVAEALVAAVASWGTARGLTELVGPFNLSINEECGVLVDGFDSPSAIMMPQGRPYYDGLLQRTGLTKAMDLVAFRMDVQAAPPEVEHILERVTPRVNLGVRLLNTKRLRQEVDVIVDIFNDAWANNWGHVPMTEAEIDALADTLRLLLRPDSAAFVTLDGQDVAMMVALPDLNALTQDFDGRLTPLTIARLIWRVKVARLPSARVVLFGVRQRFHNQRLGGLIIARLVGQIRRAALQMGLDWIEFSWILETNRPVIDLCTRLSGPPVKRYRLYHKPLVC